MPLEQLPPLNRRIKQVIDYYSDGNVSAFANELGNISQQKLNRLFHIDKTTGKYPVPSTDILVSITQIFVDVDANWLLNEIGNFPPDTPNNNEHTPYVTNTKSVSKQYFEANSLHPTNDEKLHPTLHPTQNASPTNSKNASPSASPTVNLGLPKVVTINEKEEEVIHMVGVKAAAGYLNGYGDPEYIERLPTIRYPGLKGGTHRAFEVKGHSMEPTLHNGSIAIGRWVESFSEIRDRRIYIVVHKTEGIVIKRVLNRIDEANRLILVSDNLNQKDYPNIILDPSDVLELWYLRADIGFEFPEPGDIYSKFNDLEAKVTIMADQLQKLLK